MKKIFAISLFAVFMTAIKAQNCAFDYVGQPSLSPNFGWDPSIAVNPVGDTIVVAFRDSTISGISCYFFDSLGSQWLPLAGGDVSFGEAYDPSVDFSPEGILRIAYQSPEGIHVKELVNNSWSTVGSIVETGFSSKQPSLKHSPEGEPYVAYVFGSFSGPGTVRVKKFNGSSWVLVGSSSSFTFLGLNPDLAFNPVTEEAFLAYTTFNADVKVYQFSGSSWSSINQFTSSFNYHPAAIQFNAEGELFLAYVYQSAIQVKKYDGSWTTIGNLIDAGPSMPSLSVSGENIYVTCVSSLFYPHSILTKMFDGGSWTTLSSGYYPSAINHRIDSMVLDGVLHVSFKVSSSGYISVIAFICEGCTDPNACNFDPEADQDDGSCLLPDGCTDVSAVNFDPLATCNNGSCIYLGCTYQEAINYNPEANDDDGSCQFLCNCNCPFDSNGDGMINVTDLLVFFSYFGTTCE